MSSLRKECAVVLGEEGRDRRRIDCRMVQVSLPSGVARHLEEFLDQANGTRCGHRQDAGGIGRAICESVAASSWNKNKDPAGQMFSTPSNVNTIVPSRT